MHKLDWRRDGDDFVGYGVSGVALWRIQKVYSPDPSFGWNVSGLEDLGYYESLPMAKEACQRETLPALNRDEVKIR